MKSKIPDIIKRWPVFLYLLPLFFVLHGITENYGMVTFKEAVSLIFLYLIVAGVISFLSWLVFRNYTKACLIAFFILSVQFFFGSFHDFLRANFSNSFITKYSILLPAIFIALLLISIFLKRSLKLYIKAGYFLNILLIILIIADLISLTIKNINHKEIPRLTISDSFIACDTCKKPDIYLILADEYSGKKQLKDIFSFNNDSFEVQLSRRGFHVVNDSRSNYNKTFYSMASCLNMKYLEGLRSSSENNYDNFYCFDEIKQNDLTTFFEQEGYQIYNYSIFDFKNNPRLNNSNVLPTGSKLITSQTLTNRIMKNMGFHFASRSFIEKILKHNLYINQKTDSFTRKIIQQKTIKPKFVYSHFILPHYPYFFDKNGKEADFNTLLNDDFAKTEKSAYLEYLQYANKYLLGLIDHIKSISERPPIIILISDHAFRQFEEGEKVDPKYYFMNLNAIYLPSGNYSGFYDGMTNVNEFRIILNTEFGQKLPLLKDSVSFIWDH